MTSTDTPATPDAHHPGTLLSDDEKRALALREAVQARIFHVSGTGGEDRGEQVLAIAAKFYDFLTGGDA